MLTPSPRLVCFGFWLPRPADPALPAPLVSALIKAMAAHLAGRGWPGAEPLRWAITAADPKRGWWLEGVAVAAAPGLAESP